MPADVSNQSPGYKAALTKWRLPMALMGGTRAMRDNPTEWLPKYPGEDSDDWLVRVNNTTLTNVYKKTVGRLSSTPFAKPITFDQDVDDRVGGIDGVGGWATNVDRSGTDVTTFARDLLVDLLVFGKCHIYVDYPNTGEGKLTLADLDRMDIRPYMRRISPKDLFAWDVSVEKGTEVINELRWKEKIIERPTGSFEEKEREQIRAVYPDRVEIWRKAAAGAAGNQWIQTEEHPVILPTREAVEEQRIPFVTIYANKQAPMVSDPPLEDLADLNLKHLRIDSDLQRILHVNCIPFMLATGFSPKELEDTVIGPNTIVEASNPGADMKFVEHTGQSISLIQESLKLTQEDMERMSLEMISKSGTGDITATEKAINTAEQTSELQEIVRNMEAGITSAFHAMLMWVGEEDPENDVLLGVNISSDFGLVFRSESDLQILIQLFLANAISHDTMLQEAKCRGLLNEAIEIDEESKEGAGRSRRTGATDSESIGRRRGERIA